MRKPIALALGLGLGFAHIPMAQAFTQIERAEEFVAAISGKDLTRTGIRLIVSPEGQITGRAFGRKVTGDWRWQDGYFCRDLNWGAQDLGYNCQMVQQNGSALRFTSDRGAGAYADLWLK
ncbi:MAG: dihydrodipicolinate reductase [Mangrovicoccus sp.]|nr:dihydrodipicolinate reductase [Mangrovicoccus sp.]